MATEFVIRVKVDPGDAVSTANGVGKALDKAKEKADDLAGTLKEAFGLYFVEQAIEEIGKITDGYTGLQNRLRSVATDTANLNGLTEATYKIAQETRTSWEEVAGMYSRVARNAANLGYSQQDLLKFQVALNQAVKIGGATSMEASAGLVQLSQGLASGTLRGDELRSVLEQLPVVADTIAKHMGVTRGELRTLGKEGKLSGRAVVDAFLEASDSLKAEFGKTVPTMAEEFIMLRNAAQLFFGESSVGMGTLNGLKGVVEWLIAHFDTVGKVIIIVADLLGTYLATRAVAKAIDALKMLGMAALANPFTALLYVIVALVAAIQQFGDKIDVGSKHWYDATQRVATLRDVLMALWEVIKGLGEAVVHFVEEGFGKLQDAFSTGVDDDKVKMGLNAGLMDVIQFVSTVVAVFQNMKQVIIALLVDIPIELANAFVASYPVIMEVIASIANTTAKVVNGIKDLVNGAKGLYLNKQIEELSRIRSEQLAGDKAAGASPEQTSKNYAAITSKIQDLRSQTDAIKPSEPVTFDADAMARKLSEMARAARDHRVNTTKDIEADADANAKYFVELIDRVKKANDEASKIGTDKGKEATPPNDGKARAKLQKELDAVRAESNPITAAIQKIDKAMDVLDAALAHKMIKLPEYMRIYGDLMDKLRDVIMPYEAYIKKLNEEEAAIDELLSGKKAMSDIDKEMVKIRHTLHEQGVEISADQEHELRQHLEIIEIKKHELDVIKQLREENKKMATDQEKYQEALKKYDERTGVGMDAVIDGLKKVRAEAYNVGKDMREVFVAFYKRVSDAIVTFVKDGTFDWKQFVEQTLEDIERILVKLATLDVVNALGLGEKAPVAPKAVLGPSMVEPMTTAGTEVGETWFESIMNAGMEVAQEFAAAIAGAGGANYLGAGAAGIASALGRDGSAAADAAQAAEIAYIGRAPTVAPPSVTNSNRSNSASGSQQRIGGGPVNLRVINVHDQRAALGAVDTREGEKVVTNFMRRNAGYIRGITGTRRG